MSDAPLLVPMHLDAMVLGSDAAESKQFLRFQADYTELASFGDVGPTPFGGGDPSQPPPGVYLHWTLPRPLRHGVHDEDAGTKFPIVPNRWIVVRVEETAGAEMKAWLVESDHVDPDHGQSAYVDPKSGRATRIGRCRNLANVTAADLSDQRGGFLTAVGPGSAHFASFEPGVGGVFALYDDMTAADDETPLADGSSLTYLVAGWYADRSQDPLHAPRWEPAAAPSDALIEHDLRLVMRFPDGDRPDWILVHALAFCVPWSAQSDSRVPDEYPDVRKQVQIAVGNTATDALARLAEYGDGGHPREAKLLQALQYGAVDTIGLPGGEAALDVAVRDHWFGAVHGGRAWTVVDRQRDATHSPSSPELSDGLRKALADLNASQRAHDQQRRVLASMRANLYALWWKYQRTQADDGFPPRLPQPLRDWLTTQLKVHLGEVPAGTGAGAATPYVQQVRTQKQTVDGLEGDVVTAEGKVKGLLDHATQKLRSVNRPHYRFPNDPVLLVSGLNRSTDIDPVGDLTCRLVRQVVDALVVGASPGVTAPTLPGPASVPPAGMSDLLLEAILLSPQLFATHVLGDATRVREACAAIAALPAPAEGGRFAPAAGAAVEWQQPWVPLLLDWHVKVLDTPAYKPTGPSGFGSHFELDGTKWTFHRDDYVWADPIPADSSGFDEGTSQMALIGRTFITPHAPVTLAKQLDKYLADHATRDPDVDLSRLDARLHEIRDLDILSQRLSGLRAAMVQRDVTPGAAPTGDIAALLGGDVPHGRPAPYAQFPEPPIWDFAPLSGSFFVIDRLAAVDFMGRTIDLLDANASQAKHDGDASWFRPIAADGLRAPSTLDPAPTQSPTPTTGRMLQLPPRVVQPAQLSLGLISAAGGTPVDTATDSTPVCGWLVPNHLDRSLSVYGADGTAWGELGLAARPDGFVPFWWSDPTNSAAPQNVDDVPDPYLRGILHGLWERPDAGDAIAKFLRAIDHTLWTVDPLGGNAADGLDVLVGRPLAVVRAAVQFKLHGLPAYGQDWLDTFDFDPLQAGDATVPRALGAVDGGIHKYTWPVRLGSDQLRDDGLVGYFADTAPGPPDSYGSFSAVVVPEGDETDYLHAIGPGNYLELKLTDDLLDTPDVGKQEVALLTMLIDPRGSVHAFSGLQPVVELQLPAGFVTLALRRMAFTFRAGPVLAAADGVRVPLAKTQPGDWSWFDHGLATQVPLGVADGRPDLQPAPRLVREGWMKLTPREPPRP